MPQLDKASFIAQLIYFFGIFFILWVSMSKTFLPSLGKTLKLRKIIFGANIITNKEKEITQQKIIFLKNLIEETPYEFKLLGREHLGQNVLRMKKESLKRNFLKKLLTKR